MTEILKVMTSSLDKNFSHFFHDLNEHVFLPWLYLPFTNTKMQIQSNWVITDSLGPAEIVDYSRVLL